MPSCEILLKFNKKNLRVELWIGAMYGSLAVSSALFNEHWQFVLWLFLSARYLLVAFYKNKRQYATITKECVRLNQPRWLTFLQYNEVPIKDIVRVYKQGDEYVLQTRERLFKLSYIQLSKESQQALRTFMQNINDVSQV